MSVLNYLHTRECGGVRRQSGTQQKLIEHFLEQKVTENFVNKACSVSGHCRSTFITEFSPDGTKVASTHGDHTVRVTDIATGKCIRTLRGHARTPWCLAYHPSYPNILASGCLAGQVRIWDLYRGSGCDSDSGVDALTCEVWQTENSTVIAALTFHPVDHVLIIASGNSIYFWDWSKPEPFAKCSTKYEFERIRWVRFDHLGHNLYTGISNNTAAHRAETLSVNSRERGTPSSHPLLSAYDSIMSSYQEFRHNAVLEAGILSNLNTNMGPPVQRQMPTVSQSQTRQNEILLSSYASRLSQQARQELERDGQTFRGSRGCALLNNNNDPFLPSMGRDADDAARPASIWTESHLVGGHTRSESLAEGVSTEHTSRDRSSRSHGFVTSSSSQTMERLSSALNTASDIDISDRALRRTINETSNTTSEEQSTSSEQRDRRRPLRPTQDSSPCTSYSQTIAKLILQKRMMDSQSQSGQPHSKRQCTDPGTSSSTDSGTSVTSSASINTSRSRPLLLSRYLARNQGNQSRSSAQRPFFQNIRERLQTTIPLDSSNRNTVGSGSVRVISASETSGIPAVTVISSRTTLTETTVSGQSLPTVTVLPAETLVSRSSVPTATAMPAIATDIPAVTIVSACDISSSATPVATAVPQVSIVSSRSAHSAAFNAPSEADVDVTNRSSVPVDEQGSVDSRRRRVGQLLHDVMQIESQLQAVAGETGLLHNVTPASRHTNDPVQTFQGSRTNVNRLSDYQRLPGVSHRDRDNTRGEDARTMFSSLMGPYLHSRGVFMDNTSAIPYTSSSSAVSDSSVITSFSSTTTEDTVVSDTPAREQTSSIDAELESPEHPSRAYFLPISSDPSRTSSTVSSLSASSSNRSSQNLSLQDTPVSQDSVQGVELVMDQNDNYSTSANVNTDTPARDQPSISVQDQDRNNNSIHIITNANPRPSDSENRNTNQRRDFTSLINSYDVFTNQMEREMNDLSRRITALRDTFNRNLGVLRGEGNSFRQVGTARMSETDTSLLSHGAADGRDDDNRFASVLSGADGSTPAGHQSVDESNEQGSSPDLDRSDDEENRGDGYVSQPRTLLETSLRSHVNRRHRRLYNVLPLVESDDEAAAGGSGEGDEEHGDWRQLQRHTLHPHYSTSILDDAINRPNSSIQSAINRAIAGAFMGSGESAVANNIISQTHRIQCWDFTQYQLPDLSQGEKNVVVPHCKLHNSASCDISQTSELLATFVPSHNGFPDDNILAVYSLETRTRGQCLYTKSFGPNAISISISPQSSYLLVGLAAKRLTWVITSSQLIGQIFKLDKAKAGEKSMKHVKNVMHACNPEVRSYISGNSARWLPLSGMGLVYGTNRGDLHLCTHGVKEVVEKMNKPSTCLLHQAPWFSIPQRVSTSTQTAGVRQSASTQTDEH